MKKGCQMHTLHLINVVSTAAITILISTHKHCTQSAHIYMFAALHCSKPHCLAVVQSANTIFSHSSIENRELNVDTFGQWC